MHFNYNNIYGTGHKIKILFMKHLSFLMAHNSHWQVPTRRHLWMHPVLWLKLANSYKKPSLSASSALIKVISKLHCVSLIYLQIAAYSTKAYDNGNVTMEYSQLFPGKYVWLHITSAYGFLIFFMHFVFPNKSFLMLKLNFHSWTV